jgi:hypothetical protein
MGTKERAWISQGEAEAIVLRRTKHASADLSNGHGHRRNNLDFARADRIWRSEKRLERRRRKAKQGIFDGKKSLCDVGGEGSLDDDKASKGEGVSRVGPTDG